MSRSLSTMRDDWHSMNPAGFDGSLPRGTAPAGARLHRREGRSGDDGRREAGRGLLPAPTSSASPRTFHFPRLALAVVMATGLPTTLPVVAIEGPEGLDAEEDFDPEQGEPSSVIRALRLPQWQFDDLREFEANDRPVNLGGGLWPEELFPLPKPPPRIPPTPLSEEELADRARTPAVPQVVPLAVRPSYFESRPSTYLVDPQELIPAPFRTNVERFLDYHARNSELDTYVLVFKESQEIPDEVSSGALWRRWFGTGTGAILFFHLNRPEFSALEVGRQFAREAGRQRLQSTLDACVRDALTVGDPAAQLERFLVEYSTQLHRMARTLAAGNGNDDDENHANAATTDATGDDDTSSLTVDLAAGGTEFGASQASEGLGTLAGSTSSSSATRPGRPRSRGLVVLHWIASIVAFSIAAAAGIWLASSLRRFRFPEIELPPRLGGGSTGGTDVVVSFAGRHPGDGKPDPQDDSEGL